MIKEIVEMFLLSEMGYCVHRIFPVLRGCICPTFLPGGACFGAMEGFPMCRPLPEPKGCSIAFIATAEVTG